MTGVDLAGRLRRIAAWRRSTARVVTIRCPYCKQWRPARQFRRGDRGCRGCIGNG
jgi:hypothetical protein